MARTIYVNLPVKDVTVSTAFFTALGWTQEPQFSDGTASAMVVEDNIMVMLLERAKFADFVNGPVADAHAATEVILCLSADSREQVDAVLAKALDAGGKPWKPTMDAGPMYGVSFQDPDGHVWEVMHLDLPGS